MFESSGQRNKGSKWRYYVLSKCRKSKMHVFICKSYVLFHTNMCSKSNYIRLCMYLCLLLLSVILLVCYFLPPCKVREGIFLCLSGISLVMPVLFFSCWPFLVWPFPFFEKSNCDIKYAPKMLSVIRLITTVLVKLLQII